MSWNSLERLLYANPDIPDNGSEHKKIRRHFGATETDQPLDKYNKDYWNETKHRE
jgi:hypothetical protein